MKAYSNGKLKAYPERSEHVPGTSKGVSESEKLATKNYNRSLKKQERVKAKREICDHLNNSQGWNIYDGNICNDCGEQL